LPAGYGNWKTVYGRHRRWLLDRRAAVLDGSKALLRAVKDVFDKPLIQRCQQHYADLVIMPIRAVSPLVAPV